MKHLRDLQKGDVLECIGKHRSSKANITIGYTYEVVRAKMRNYRHENRDICYEFFIIDDRGQKIKFTTHTKSFMFADEIYTTEQLNLMIQFKNEIEYMISLKPSLEAAKKDPEYEVACKVKAREYIRRIKLNK